MEVASTDFWQTMDFNLFAEILGACVGSYGIGYATGFKFYAFRRFFFGSIS